MLIQYFHHILSDLKYLLNQVLEYPEYNTQEQLLKLALEYKKGRE